MKLPDNRKAQVTVFIILGIIILISVGIYSYMRYTGITPADVFQPKAPPVVEFVHACMDKIGTDAIRIMGNQGGYIELPPQIAANPTAYVSLVPGVGGAYAPKVPYWYYEGRMINPSVEYMEKQVENYVNRNLDRCINDYTAMSEEYLVTENSEYQAHVVFTEEDVVISLDYEIFIQPRGAEEITAVDTFIVKIPVPIRKMHSLALEILEAENERTFFENMTMNLMGSHPSDMIPFSGLSLDCRRKQWLLSDIKKHLNDALEPAVSGIRFKHTYNPGFPLENEDRYEEIRQIVEEYNARETLGAVRDDNGVILSIPGPRLPEDIPEDTYEYFQYYFDFTDNKRSYKDLSVMASYKDEWGMNLVANPNQHGVLKSGQQDLKSEIMSFLCLQTYHFTYDVIYPVMVSVNDPRALYGRGYTFRYAFPVQIFHNRADRKLLPARVIEPIEYVEDYCGVRGGEEQIIIAKDMITDAELSKVNLTFTCFHERCDLGSTRSNNRHLQWSGQFPEGCYGPIITANRTGYLEREKQFDGRKPFYIEMFPTQEVIFDVKRNPENAIGLGGRMLQQDTYAVIQVSNDNPPISIFESFGSEDVIHPKGTIELLRADATYDVNIMLIKRGQEDILIGGWMGNWTVNMEDMLDAHKVVFNVVEMYPHPTQEDDYIHLFEVMTNRSVYPEIVPEIIRADEWTGE